MYHAHILSLLLNTICIFCFIAWHSEQCFWTNTAFSFSYEDFYYTDDEGNEFTWDSCKAHCQEDPQCTVFEYAYWGECRRYHDSLDIAALTPQSGYDVGLRDCALGMQLKSKVFGKTEVYILYIFLYIWFIYILYLYIQNNKHAHTLTIHAMAMQSVTLKMSDVMVQMIAVITAMSWAAW